MKWINLHSDTLMQTYALRTADLVSLPEAHMDVRRMKASDAVATFFAVFMPQPGAESYLNRDEAIDDEEYMAYLFQSFDNTLDAAADDIALARSVSELEENDRAGKMSALLSFEDGRPVKGSIERLRFFFDRGLRLITLTWNDENCFGHPNSSDPERMRRGLKPFGIEALAYMNEWGMLIDVSHLSDGGFMDVAAHSKKPFLATHSNCRALSNVPRNLSDEMLRILADKGGVAGVNFGPQFLHADPTRTDSTVAAMSAHIRHMIQVGGEGLPAIGTDFDGVEGELEIDSVEKIGLLFDQLHRDGLSDDCIEKVAYHNALRVMRDSMG